MMHASHYAKAAREVINALLLNGASRATKFISETDRVTVSRILFRGRIGRKTRSTSLVVSFGAPNYAERDFIARCKRSGEPFPVKKVQLKFPGTSGPSRKPR